MVSAEDYAAMDQLKMELLQQSIQRSMSDLAAGKVHDGKATLEAMIREDRVITKRSRVGLHTWQIIATCHAFNNQKLFFLKHSYSTTRRS